MAMFIRVDIKNDVVRTTAGLAKKLVEVCPVNLFKTGADANAAETVEENLDECTLCDLCMQASPDGVKVVKLYE